MALADSVTGLVLAGGRATRMGGVDKGLQLFHGVPLALHAIRRLQPQVQQVLLNANRNLDVYQRWGVPVLPDAVGAGVGGGVTEADADPHDADARPAPRDPFIALPAFIGPLAGFLAGLKHCPTPLLATVPCDSPLFPPDLVARLAQALHSHSADIAVACAPEAHAEPGLSAAAALRIQPVFCLLRTRLAPGLGRFLECGGRGVGQWLAREHTVQVAFDAPGDSRQAFSNVNTLTQLQQLQQSQPARHGPQDPGRQP